MKILDLFCGAGGFFQGFSSLSYDKHLAIDIDEDAIETYRINHSNATVLQTDINNLHSQQIVEELGGMPDIIIASPPCEEFSKANPDSRGSAAEKIYGEGTAKLLLDTIRLIGDLAPKVFVIENVAALLLDGGKEIIKREFERVDIDNVVFNLIRAHQHGNPSKRLRVFISNIPLKLPKTSPPTVMETIGALPSLDINEIFSPGLKIPNHEVYPLADDKMASVRKTRWGKGAKHSCIKETESSQLGSFIPR
ncbi:MAG: DNA cytosine methyltransferase [Candidatus Thorarchaeota archaeon]|nr:MAG: DNA cytosine methyltransferase [Candidatus Thorarchaeota archaeon]